ncbi:hypothetical protein HGA34_05115 [Candidatus Falkowbacteria bacterium]|nr:hypothetical protein [Candidatus Falkowbacteria bacterium]
MTQDSQPAPKFHILCPDLPTLEGFRFSSRLFLALQWHTPHATTFGKGLTSEEFERMDANDHIFCFFPLTKSDRLLEYYVGLMVDGKDRNIDCYVFTYTFGGFETYESMIDWLTDLILVELPGIYDQES